jgi:hypothetical protein
LAGYLKKTVAELLDQLADYELDYWWGFYQLEPFGNEWWRHGQLCATVGNFSFGGAKRSLKPHDFMPISPPPTKPLDSETLHKRWLCAVAACGLQIVDTTGKPISIAEAAAR